MKITLRMKRKILFFIQRSISNISNMSATSFDDQILRNIKKVIPDLSATKYKGRDGKIGVIGGSSEYTGAPFFSAMSAFRTGADLVHIFTTTEASTPIKSFSPEPIVHPILGYNDAASRIRPWLDRLDVILIGPGLGREEGIFKSVSELISICREMKKPLVLDADALFLICQNPNLVKDYPNLIVTPNAMEFTRLMKAYLNKTVAPVPKADVNDIKELATALGVNATVFSKGLADTFVDGSKGSQVFSCNLSGSGRRCGGQGDILGGALAVFWSWALKSDLACEFPKSALACYAASRLTRECNAAAFTVKHRGMLASDMLDQIHLVFAKTFENTSC